MQTTSLIDKIAEMGIDEILNGIVMNQDQITAYYAGLVGGLVLLNQDFDQALLYPGPEYRLARVRHLIVMIKDAKKRANESLR